MRLTQRRWLAAPTQIEALVLSERKRSYIRALLFFDTGAHVSLIEEHVAESLALPVFHSEQCTLSGIGGITDTFVCHHVRMNILSAHGKELQIPLRTKPTLVEGFPSVLLTEKDIEFMEENDICLSNSRVRGEMQRPHIIIGIDLFSSLVLEHVPPEEIICAPAAEVEEKEENGELVDLQRFGSLSKTLRVIAYVAKFIQRLVERVNTKKSRNMQLRSVSQFDPQPYITKKDMELAELMILRHEHKAITLKELQARNRDKNIFRDEQGIIQTERTGPTTALPAPPHRRPTLPRAAKTKAYEARQQKQQERLRECSQNEQTTRTQAPHLNESSKKEKFPSHKNMETLLFLTLLMICPALTHQKTISCLNGSVTIWPPQSAFELCFDSTCKRFGKLTTPLQYKLPPSPTNSAIKVTMRHRNGTETRFCHSIPFCEHASKFLSKRLLANPHCWPTGALITLGVILYFFASMLVMVIWFVRNRSKKKKAKGATASLSPGIESVELSVLNPRHKPAPFSLSSFSPAILRPLPITVIIGLCLIVAVQACQNGFIRHSIELTCTDHNECHYEYRDEVLFNKVQSSLCIELRHSNVSVGSIKLQRQPLQLECSKLSWFWTRSTQQQVRYVTRCRGMGSCTGNTCESLEPKRVIPELNSSAMYPGYSACSVQCSGINCICAIPIRPCTFFRVIHVPISPNVYEIFECSAWDPIIKIDATIRIYNEQRTERLTLLPYTTASFGNFNFTVISLQKMQLHRHQFRADYERDYCSSSRLSSFREDRHDHNFLLHKRSFLCCDVSGNRPRCHCPHNNLSQLRRNPDYVLSIYKPRFTLRGVNRSIVSESTEEELTLAISSTINLDRATLSISEPCVLDIGPLQGCYSCTHGSRASISCFTLSNSWTTIKCEKYVFSVECNPHNKTTLLHLASNKAVVDSECYTTCGGRNVSAKLQGILYYHPYVDTSNIMVVSTSEVLPQFDWFDDFSLPDLSPLWLVAVNHWSSHATNAPERHLQCDEEQRHLAWLFACSLFLYWAPKNQAGSIRICMADDIDRDIQLMELEYRASMESLTETVCRISNRLEAVLSKVSQIQDDIHVLMERTAPTSNCAFCPVGENLDNHHTARCHRHPDPVSRAMRASELHLCVRCLRPEHGGNCNVTCSFCRGGHNNVLCSQRTAAPFKRRHL
ncbi:hypothetical protein OSTOST_04667 [Ostertagia ostertagi]